MTQLIAWGFFSYGVLLLFQTLRQALRSKRWTLVSYGITMAALGCWSIAAADLIYEKFPDDARLLFVGVGMTLFIIGHTLAWFAEKRGIDKRPALR